MAIKSYPYDSTEQISAHFNAQEFKCKCGQVHDTLISEELVQKLENLRSTLDCKSIVITSGYRCLEHDAEVSTGKGQHTKGTAADIVCYDKNGQTISSKLVCCKAQNLGFTGIANITSNYDCTHVDVRSSGKWYGDETQGNGNATNDFYAYFGIQKENTILARGIDVSYAQGKVDWSKVKSSGKVNFAILRAGYGREISQIDSQFERNYSECKRLGIPVGAYWYSYAKSTEGARKEAKTFLQAIKNKTFEYPVYFDMEEPSQFALGKQICSDMAEAFCSEVEKAGYYTGLYSSTSYLNTHLTDSVKNRYTVWVAQYNKELTYKGTYGIWQYGVAGHSKYDTFSTGSVPGVNGQCDLDYAYVDYPAIIKNAGLNGFKAENSSNESGKDNSESNDNDKADTLEQILQHVASIDEKIK